jgi:hypothetical protein
MGASGPSSSRGVLAPEIEALLHRFPNVIAWVNGHTHNNVIDPRPDPDGRTAGFWDVGTAAHIDWISQSRLIEVAHRADGTLSIFCTMVNHDAPPDPAGAVGRVARLASIHRELCANDYQYGFSSKGPGGPRTATSSCSCRPRLALTPAGRLLPTVER